MITPLLSGPVVMRSTDPPFRGYCPAISLSYRLYLASIPASNWESHRYHWHILRRTGENRSCVPCIFCTCTSLHSLLSWASFLSRLVTFCRHISADAQFSSKLGHVSQPSTGRILAFKLQETCWVSYVLSFCSEPLGRAYLTWSLLLASYWSMWVTRCTFNLLIASSGSRVLNTACWFVEASTEAEKSYKVYRLDFIYTWY